MSAAADFDRRSLLEAVLARLIPADEHGPGAREVDTLAHLGRSPADERERCELALAWLSAAATTTAGAGAAFEELDAARQDALLAALEHDADHGAGFELIRRRAIEAFFATAAGWELIGYPGPRPAWSAAEQQLGELPGQPR